MALSVQRLTGVEWKSQGTPFLLGFGHCATHWLTASLFLLMPFVAGDLGLSYSEVGVLVGLLHFSSAAANVGSGLVVDVTGRRVIYLVIALILGGSAFVGFGASTVFGILGVLIVLIGVCVNLWHPAAISYLSVNYPGHRGYALSIHALGASAADALAPLAAGALLVWMSWRGVALTSGGLVLLAALPVALILLPKDRPTGTDTRRGLGLRDYWSGLKALVSNRSLLGLCAMAGFRTMTVNGLYLFLPLYLANELGLSPILIGATMTALQIGGFIGTPIAGTWSDRVGRRTVMIAGLTLTTVILITLAATANVIVFVAGVSILGFVLFSVRPVIQSWVMDLTPAGLGGSATSLLFGVQSALSTLAPVIGGIVADHWGLTPVFALLAATILVANLLVFLVPKEEKRSRAC